MAELSASKFCNSYNVFICLFLSNLIFCDFVIIFVSLLSKKFLSSSSFSRPSKFIVSIIGLIISSLFAGWA